MIKNRFKKESFLLDNYTSMFMSLPERCPAGWHLHKNGDYATCIKLINPGPITWFDARNKCLEMGGDLLGTVKHGIEDYLKTCELI